MQIYSNAKKQTYRLDRLDDGQYDELGMLPSTLEALLQATDKANSFAFTSMRKRKRRGFATLVVGDTI